MWRDHDSLSPCCEKPVVEGQTVYTSEPRHGGLKRAQGQMDGLVKLAGLCAAESDQEVFSPLPLGVSFPRYSTLDLCFSWRAAWAGYQFKWSQSQE